MLKSPNHQSRKSFRPVILGQFGPPVLASLRSWARQGWQTGLICIGKKDTPLPQSRHLNQVFRIDPELLYTDEGLRLIRACLDSFRASGLSCVQERQAMWLDRNRAALEGYDLWVPPAESTQRVLSKQKQIEAACVVGLDCLPTYYVDKDHLDVLDDIPEEHFPLCFRPSGGGRVVPGFKVCCISSVDKGREFIKGLQSLQSPLIAQPFRNLPNLVVHGARSLEGESYGLQGFLVKRKFEGLTLTLGPMDLAEDFKGRCVEFTREMGIVGNYHFEFLHDPSSSKNYFLEVNARLGGTTAKALALGYDEPALALKSYGVDIKNGTKMRNVTASSRLALAKYLHYSITNRITPLDYPSEPKWKRIVRTLWGLAFYRDEVISFQDLKGSWTFYRQALAGKLRG